METKYKNNKLLNLLFLNRKELEYFIDNLAILISSGMTVLGAVSAVQYEIKSKLLRNKIDQIIDDLSGGLNFSDALQRTHLFSDRVLFLIRIGEKSGRLAENLQIINTQEIKERELRSKLTSALIYPSIILTLTFVIALVVGIFVLPRLSAVYTNLSVDLPPITRFMIAFGTFLGNYGFIVLPIFIFVILLAAYLLFIYKKTKKAGQFLLFSMSASRRIITEIEISRMGFILGTLLRAGVPIVDALDLLYSSSDFYKFKEFYAFLLEKIQEGFSFEASFKKYKNLNKLIPPSVTQLIITGEKSGTLPELFLQVSQNYEIKSDNSTKNLTIILEPALLILVYGGVVFIAFAVIVPIYSLVGNIDTAANPDPSATVIQSENPITPTSTITQILTPTLNLTPTITQTPTPTPALPKLQINSSAGYLNVRDRASSAGNVVAQVNDGEIFEYKDYQSGWYELILSDGNTGWVLGQYITKL